MTGKPDDDFPLHDEAEARSKWRGGETLLDKGDTGTSGPASEVDDAAQGSRSGENELLKNASLRPPD